MPCENKTFSEIENVDLSNGGGGNDSGNHYTNVRFGSASSQDSQSSGDICRICHCESDPQNPLLTPCYCAGSLKYVHQTCLQQWLTASETNSCELCKFPFIMHTKIKPFNEWRSLDISGIEKRRLCCSVLFHFAAALCVIWSLCVLIERAADDVQRGLINWPFWTKLAVVTVGLTGGIVFMYIQCKAYLHLCHRWKARNRILLIQNAPEKIHPLSPPSLATQLRLENVITETHGGAHSHLNEPCMPGSIIASSCGQPIGTTVNATSTSNTYNCVATVGTCLVGTSFGVGHLDGAEIDSIDTLHRHHHISPLSSGQNMQEAEVSSNNSFPILSSTNILHHQQPSHHDISLHQDCHHQHEPSQVAVAANIEFSQSQQNYERDWALDDVSQISSFRPCPQGSGSMIPFHESINVRDTRSESSSRGNISGGSRQNLSVDDLSTDNTHDHAFQSSSGSVEPKATSISSDASNIVAKGMSNNFACKPSSKRYSNSSIFLENRDILDSVSLGLDNPNEYSHGKFPHSNIPTILDCEYKDANPISNLECDKSMQKSDAAAAATNKTDYEIASKTLPISVSDELLKQHSTADASVMLDLELLTSPLSPPADFNPGASQFASQCKNAHQTDTLRQSIQTIKGNLSGGNLNMKKNYSSIIEQNKNIPTNQQVDKARLFFKSLPNLSSSCESLIKN